MHLVVDRKVRQRRRGRIGAADTHHRRALGEPFRADLVKPLDAGGQRLGIFGRHEHPRHAVRDDFGEDAEIRHLGESLKPHGGVAKISEAARTSLLAAIASKILPVVLLMPVLMVALPLSGIAGVVYALQFNRTGKRQRLFGDEKKQLKSGED